MHTIGKKYLYQQYMYHLNIL